METKRSSSIKDRTDHTGRVFDTRKEMIMFWGRRPEAYYQAIRDGRSQEEALTGVYNLSKGSTLEDRTDHLGNIYKTEKDMCKHYGITHSTYFHRIHDSGWSKERALTTTPCRIKKLVYDGVEFRNEHELCDYVGISYNRYTNYKLRKRCNYEKAIKDILNGKVKPRANKVIDSSGKEYRSLNAFCKDKNLDVTLAQFMINKGYSIEDIENTKSWEELHGDNEIVDPFGNVFKCKLDLANHYKIPYSAVLSRFQRGWSIEEVLELSYRDCKHSREFYRNVKIVKQVYQSDKEYFLCILDGKEEVLSEEEIKEFNKSIEAV